MPFFDFEDDLEDDASILVQSTNFLIDYGWYLVGLGIFYLVFRDKINKLLDTWYERRENKKYSARYHKDSELSKARMKGMEAAIQKMQEELNREAEKAEIKRKEREEIKRLEKLRNLDHDAGRNRLEGPSSSKSTLKSEYNPLMNDSGSRYRPPKRSCCKKGGCG